MKRLLTVVVAASIGFPLLVATGGQAIACSCAPVSPERAIRRADAIVAGHVVSEIPVDPVTTHSVMAVDGVYRGDVPATITLTANIGVNGGSSCAVLYPVGSTVDPLVLTDRGDGTYEIQACALLSLDAVRGLLGEPAAPEAPPAGTSPPPLAAAPAAASPGLSWIAVLGGLAIAIALMGWALRRSGRAGAEAEAVAADPGGPALDPDGVAPDPAREEPTD